MNLEKKEAQLKGYDGPIFPRKLDALNSIIAETSVTLDPDSLECMRESMQDHLVKMIKIDRPKTEDGCSDWLGFHFEITAYEIKEGSIVVLLPCPKKEQKPKRSAIVYARGEGPCFAAGSMKLAIDRALDLLTREFSKFA